MGRIGEGEIFGAVMHVETDVNWRVWLVGFYWVWASYQRVIALRIGPIAINFWFY